MLRECANCGGRQHEAFDGFCTHGECAACCDDCHLSEDDKALKESVRTLYEAQREAMGDLFIERVSFLERKQEAHRTLMAQLRGSLMLLQGGRA